MADFKQECKLCDKIISDKHFKVIEDVAKDIFDFLLLKLTLIDTQNVICMTCYSKLIAALNFKTKCLYTDNTIIPYVDFINSKPDLKQIYAKEKGSKQGGSMLEDREVCRLCLEPIFGDYKSIQKVPLGSIEIYIPEINFQATTNPVICIECYDALHVHSTFIKNWVDVDKRNGDAKTCGEIFLNDQSIKTEEIEFKSEETDGEILLETLCNIKKEEQDEGGIFIKNCLDVDKKRNGNAMNDEEIFLNDQSIKTEEILFGDTSLQSLTDLKHTDQSKSLYELDHLKQTSAQSIFENKQSEECSFKSTFESTSADQERRHKRVSEGQANKSDCSDRNSKCQCLTRGFKVQEYQCDKCTYNTKRKDSFMQHQLIDKDPSEVQMYECDKCSYRSIRKIDLKKHQWGHKYPSGVKVYKCDECHYKSIKKGNLLKHQLKHKDPSEVKMYKCEKCKFITKSKRGLTQHCLKHRDPSEVRVFQCDECDYKSIHKALLKRHQLIHKDPSEVKMFKCDKCTFESKYKCDLKKHCLTHKDPSEVKMYKCDMCTFETKHRNNLVAHYLTHKDPAEVKMFKCDKCTFETKHKNNLITHYLIHMDPAEVKMFKCVKCTFETKHKNGLIRHYLRHRILLK